MLVAQAWGHAQINKQLEKNNFDCQWWHGILTMKLEPLPSWVVN